MINANEDITREEDNSNFTIYEETLLQAILEVLIATEVVPNLGSGKEGVVKTTQAINSSEDVVEAREHGLNYWSVSPVSPDQLFAFILQEYIAIIGQDNYNNLPEGIKEHLHRIKGKKVHLSHKLGLRVETTDGLFEEQAPHTQDRIHPPTRCYSGWRLHHLLLWMTTHSIKMRYYHPTRGINPYNTWPFYIYKLNREDCNRFNQSLFGYGHSGICYSEVPLRIVDCWKVVHDGSTNPIEWSITKLSFTE
jgi:hypothetical protein